MQISLTNILFLISFSCFNSESLYFKKNISRHGRKKNPRINYKNNDMRQWHETEQERAKRKREIIKT